MIQRKPNSTPSTRAMIGAGLTSALIAYLAQGDDKEWLFVGIADAVGAAVGYNWNRLVAGFEAARTTEANPSMLHYEPRKALRS